MTKVSKKRLPHGSVSNISIKDQSVRDAVMKISENIVASSRQIEMLCDAVVELQRKVGS